MPTIALVNDTHDWYHWGCTATSSALRRRILARGYRLISAPIRLTYRFGPAVRSREDFDCEAFFQQAVRQNGPLLDLVRTADLVLINGEGTLHRLSPAPLVLLYLAHVAAVRFGKPVQIVNHSVYPDGRAPCRDELAAEIYRRVYQQLDFVAVRESISHQVLQQLGVASTLSFDGLPITVAEKFRPRPTVPGRRLLIAGGPGLVGLELAPLRRFMADCTRQGYEVEVLVGAKAWPATDDAMLVASLRQHAAPLWRLVEARSLDEWFAAIAGATVVVSGRFHHSLAAACLGTPCVLLDSHTPKNRALAQSLRWPAPVDPARADLAEALAVGVERALDEGPVDPALVSVLRERAELNLAGLASAVPRQQTTTRSYARPLAPLPGRLRGAAFNASLPQL